jgi:hypothetical protein
MPLIQYLEPELCKIKTSYHNHNYLLLSRQKLDNFQYTRSLARFWLLTPIDSNFYQMFPSETKPIYTTYISKILNISYLPYFEESIFFLRIKIYVPNLISFNAVQLLLP